MLVSLETLTFPSKAVWLFFVECLLSFPSTIVYPLLILPSSPGFIGELWSFLIAALIFLLLGVLVYVKVGACKIPKRPFMLLGALNGMWVGGVEFVSFVKISNGVCAFELLVSLFLMFIACTDWTSGSLGVSFSIVTSLSWIALGIVFGVEGLGDPVLGVLCLLPLSNTNGKRIGSIGKSGLSCSLCLLAWTLATSF